MKAVFIRAGAKVGRFFWSSGFLKFVLWTTTLIVFFYVEEDWRGARAWAATKAKWEAQGETFDFMRLAPRPVPDDQNLAALPLFKMEPDPDPDPERHGYLVPLTLQKAFSWDWEKSALPRGGLWEQGQLANAEKNRALVGAAYAVAFKNAPATVDSFAQFSALVPAVAELRAAAAERPYCRFKESYRFDLPGESSLSLITAQIKLSQFLSADAILALDGKKPDIALADIAANYKLMSGSTQQPMLVAGLVAIGMQAINLGTIYQGLATHAWNDQQLADLETQMAPIDFLAQYRDALRGETCIMLAAYDRLKPQREELASELRPKSVIFLAAPSAQRDWTPLIWPTGWIDLMKSHSADFNLSASGLVDLRNRLLSPESFHQFAVANENRNSIFFGGAIGPINNAAQKFAIAQVRLDETRLACALERYRLARGIYPPTLDALGPAYLGSVPHDIINGKPYYYQPQAAGTFLLYSVGWNQTDDGGTFVYKKGNPKSIDYENGDWPWPSPK
jgi:hypothetical protein